MRYVRHNGLREELECTVPLKGNVALARFLSTLPSITRYSFHLRVHDSLARTASRVEERYTLGLDSCEFHCSLDTRSLYFCSSEL